MGVSVYGQQPANTALPAAACLPVELQHAIMDLLDQPAVLALAGVSRSWRTAALDHKYHYLAIHIFRSQYVGTAWRQIVDDGRQLQPHSSAVAALAHAARTGIRVSIQANYMCRPSVPGLQWWYNRKDERVCTDMLHAIRGALGVVIHLRIITPCARVTGALLSGLDAPAPLLSTFILSHWKQQSKQIVVAHRIAIPSSLFGGYAPRLQNVVFARVELPTTPIPAFAEVTTAALFRTDFDGSAVWDLFPKLLTLTAS